MEGRKVREFYPCPADGSSYWVVAGWKYEGSVSADVWLRVQHSHETKAYDGKMSKEELHLTLSLPELLELYDDLHKLILERVKWPRERIRAG